MATEGRARRRGPCRMTLAFFRGVRPAGRLEAASSRRSLKLGIAVSIVLGLVAGPTAARQPADRVALVIGNSTYGDNLDLDNPQNDAADVGGALERLGFEVTTVLDADQIAFNQALLDFTRRSIGADIAFVFYAGHGMEVDGINYMVPVNARLRRDTDLRFAAVSLDDMLAATQGATLRVVILDACRDNPLARSIQRTTSTRSMSRGSFGALDEELLGDETLVAYAAAAGTTASDGTGSRNSPYTAALLEYLEQPLELSALFRRVRARVLETTARTQRPHEYSSLLRDHYLGGTSAPTTPPALPALTELRLRQELAFWETIADSDNPADFEAYLAQYADGQFARLAENRVAALQEAQLWAAIAASEDPADFAAYLEQHAEGRYAPLARQRFAVLTAPPVPTPAPARVEPDPRAIAAAPAAPEPPSLVAGRASVGADPVPTEPGATLRDCPACPEMVVLPAGTFTMGSEEGQADERPVHEVRVEAFALGRYEVTRSEFATFVAATGYTSDGCDVIDDDASLDWDDRASWQDPGFTQESRHPVVCVGWEAAEAYAQWLSAETGERYRLPSEAEWEYAARAGTATPRYWDSESGGSQCEHANASDRALTQSWRGWPLPVVNCVDGAPHTSRVGSHNPNEFGLHDMLGNVWEWTADCLHATYRGAPGDGSAWTGGGDCDRRVLRGGSWETTLGGIRAANRYWRDNRASNATGFRVARALR